jgi:hypothetical protein
MTPGERIVEITFRPIPVLVLFPLFFTCEEGMRWLGLLGLVPLAPWAGGCRTRGGGRGRSGGRFPSF